MFKSWKNQVLPWVRTTGRVGYQLASVVVAFMKYEMIQSFHDRHWIIILIDLSDVFSTRPRK